MVNLSCPADEKGTDLQYELVVSARIVGVNEEETPQPPTDFPGQGDDTDKILVSTIGDIRSSIYYVAMKVVEDSGPLPRGIRFTLNRIADVPFTALDILMSKDEEGLLQATVTAVSTTGLTSLATFGIYLGVSAVVVGTLPVTTTSFCVMLCQMGRIISFPVEFFLAESLFSSSFVHCLLKKFLLKTTMPQVEFAIPRSMEWQRLLPRRRVNSSYQTLKPLSFKDKASSRTKESLSS